MRRIPIVVITIHYAPKIMNIHFFLARKPNTEMAKEHPCNIALMMGMVCTSICRLRFLRCQSFKNAIPRLSSLFMKHMICYLTGDIDIVLSFV